MNKITNNILLINTFAYIILCNLKTKSNSELKTYFITKLLNNTLIN